MLITFQTKAWSHVTLFGDVAQTLLKLMGHSGTVPGAVLADDVAAALERLQQALAAAEPAAKPPARAPQEEEDDAAPPIGLRLRAYPLIQLLSAAAQQHCDVMWEAGTPTL